MLLASVHGFGLLVLRLFVIVGLRVVYGVCIVYLCGLVLLWYLLLYLHVLYKCLVRCGLWCLL